MAAIDSAQVRSVLEPVVAGLGVDLEDLSIKRAGRRSAIVVVIDKDGGVDLDVVAAVSSAVSAALDDSEVTGELPYVLEVTSPGVDRPLTLPRHWRRAVGRKVEVLLMDGSTLTGRVTSADDGSVRLDVAGEPREVSLAQISRALVQVEFNKGGGS